MIEHNDSSRFFLFISGKKREYFNISNRIFVVCLFLSLSLSSTHSLYLAISCHSSRWFDCAQTILLLNVGIRSYLSLCLSFYLLDFFDESSNCFESLTFKVMKFTDSYALIIGINSHFFGCCFCCVCVSSMYIYWMNIVCIVRHHHLFIFIFLF